MINSEEDLPKPRRKLLEPPPLASLSVEELNGYIGDLQAEIARVQAEITAKDAHRAAAAAFFKTGG